MPTVGTYLPKYLTCLVKQWCVLGNDFSSGYGYKCLQVRWAQYNNLLTSGSLKGGPRGNSGTQGLRGDPCASPVVVLPLTPRTTFKNGRCASCLRVWVLHTSIVVHNSPKSDISALRLVTSAFGFGTIQGKLNGMTPLQPRYPVSLRIRKDSRVCAATRPWNGVGSACFSPARGAGWIGLSRSRLNRTPRRGTNGIWYFRRARCSRLSFARA